MDSFTPPSWLVFWWFWIERVGWVGFVLKKNLFVDKIETGVCNVLVFLLDSVKILKLKMTNKNNPRKCY
jgi:hypothetical protein